MPKRVTIAEVAREARVSIATVSRVLSQRDGKIKISNETRATVQAAANRLGYQADPFASALRTGRSRLLGVIIRDLRDPFLIKVFIEMQSAAREKGMEVLLGHANYDLSIAGKQISIMNSLWFDGLAVLGDIPGDMGLVEQIQTSQKPCVAIACGTGYDLPCINVDDVAGTTLMLDYLYGLGHRRIASLGDPHLAGVKQRLSAFEEFAHQHALHLEEGYQAECLNNSESSARCAEQLMQLPTPPTAIFCGTDQIAISVIQRFNHLGIRVPEDVSVTGFDDIEEAAQTFPPLTTIRQQTDKIAQQALQVLLQRIDPAAQEKENENVLIAPELVIRTSCAAPTTCQPSHFKG